MHVVVTLDLPPSFVERVRAVDDRVVVRHHPVPEGGPGVPRQLLADAEVLYTGEALPARTEAPALRWVQLDTSGVDHVRAGEMWGSDVVITTLGGVSPAPLAEWALMMVLAHAHHLRATEALAAQRRWPSRAERWTSLMPRDLRSSTLAVVGYGSIGREVARLAQAVGMRVLAVRRDPAAVPAMRFAVRSDPEGVLVSGPDGLHGVLAQSDYVVLAVPLTPQTEGMIGAAELAALRPGAVLVNAGRGGVVDEAALLAALETGHVDQYASDVFAREPLPPEDPLWRHPRVVVTPHVAGLAPDYVAAVGELFSENLRRYLRGEPLLNVADRARGY